MTEADDHRHCKVCGKVCDPSKEFCSTKCADQRAATMRSRRQYQNLLYAMMAVLVLVLALEFVH